MANSTFSGAVRSENGFKTIDVNSTTGAITDGLVINADGNIFTDDGGHIQYAAATGYGTTVSGTPGTDAYAPGDFRRPTALGAMYSRKGKVGKKKRKTRKSKNKK